MLQATLLESLATLEDLELCTGRPIAEEDRARAEHMLTVASATLRRLTGQSLSFGESTERHDGWTGGLLLLRELPVVEVQRVEVEGCLARGWRVNHTTGALWPGAGWGWGDWGRRAWGWAGRQGILVAYTHGYKELPADLAAVVCAMAGRALNAAPEGEVQSEGLGPYRYTRANAGLGATGLTASEASVISQYRIRQQVIQ